MTNKPNLIIFSGIRPTNSNKDAACFIDERYDILRQFIPNTHLYCLTTRYSYLVQKIYSFIQKKDFVDEDNLSYLPLRFEQVVLKSGIFDQVLQRIFPRIWHNFVSSHISNNLPSMNDCIIHAHWVYPHGYIATLLAKKHNIPCIVTAHGSDIHTNPRKKRSIKKYTLKTLHSADKVIFVSQALLDSAKELGYSGENAVVIPNGIDMKYFYPMEKNDALKKTGWRQTKRYVVGFVGNLIPVKRADKFVEIFSEIQKQVRDVEFILVGDGDLADDMRSGASVAGLTVTFAGRVPHEDVCCWMNLFDVMILPSRNEGWPCVVLEAFGCGTPVVGSQNGGIAEAIGGLCPSVAEGDGFEKRFANTVCEVLKGHYPINTNCLISRAGEHTWETTVGKEIEVYLDLVKSG